MSLANYIAKYVAGFSARALTDPGIGGGGPSLTPVEQVQAIFQVPGTEGFFWDPSVLGNMSSGIYTQIQDAAVNGVVGLLLDNRPDSTLGPNIAPGGGTFTGGATGWALSGSMWEYASNRIQTKVAGAPDYAVANSVVLESGAFYAVDFDTNSNDNVNYATVYGGPYSAAANNNGGLRVRKYILGANTSYMSFRGVAASASVYVDNVEIRKMPGHPAMQNNAGKRPVLKKTGSVYWLDFDGVDDAMFTVFQTSLGTNVTIARSIPGVGASILTGQTISAGTWTDSTDHSGLIMVNRSLTAPELAAVTALLNARAGV